MITEIKQAIASNNPTLVLVLAEWCPNCKTLKTELPGIKELALLQGVNLLSMLATDPENEEFLKTNPFETLPYCLVFDEGGFKGGDSASKDMLEQLILMIGMNKKESA